MLSFLALTLVLSCVTLLLIGKVSPFVTFSTIPVLVALVAGFSPIEIQGFFIAGLTKVTPIAVMFIFAILFFSLMQERGLFEPLINTIIKRADRNFRPFCGAVCCGWSCLMVAFNEFDHLTERQGVS